MKITSPGTARWLIVADDLTGAADCAIGFARRGLAAAVGWGAAAEIDVRFPVFSYDAASRGLPAAEAAASHRAALARFLDRDGILFKKIDSTLRGQPASEIAAAMEAVRGREGRAFGILAPAFPATGRTTEDGRVLVDGRPLEEAEVWRRDHSYPNADLVEILATAGIGGVKVPLATVRSGADTLREAFAGLAARGDVVAVCDATTGDDLDRIAAASLPAGKPVFFIGSAGLAQALAAAAPGERSDPAVLAGAAGGTLIVVGSLAGASRAAARSLAELPGVRYVPADPAILLDDGAADGRAALGRAVIDGLGSGEDVLVEILTGGEPDLRIGPGLAAGLADVLHPAASRMGAFAATGGETASALLTRFGVSGLRLVDEIEPGVSLGLTLGDVAVPAVTKAGAFGDQGSLVRIVRRLRSIRNKGVLE
ncbi:four-carbon acid sugar kinase family protein [Skermanella sp. TT6]|uniref:Four-carbon acid sugar kinase family protein n=1 Tax=Skermanella cutis TaxID=2775420 RepID=A0ABX7BCM0_9PROT|nr:four-carbon acid sugar kinase family protein [Skermanella sp. TT6]QQP91335.1 four-carbon acid sugar kinase family protein [Skermanella sp. TT6]